MSRTRQTAAQLGHSEQKAAEESNKCMSCCGRMCVNMAINGKNRSDRLNDRARYAPLSAPNPGLKRADRVGAVPALTGSFTEGEQTRIQARKKIKTLILSSETGRNKPGQWRHRNPRNV